MNRRLLTALGSAALMLGTILPGATIAASPQAQDGAKRFTEAGIYIVQLRELPTIAYDGKTAGFAATKPAAGKKINMAAAAVTRYVSHLIARHDAELRAAGGHKLYDYAVSYNGFAARLTAAQANRLASDKDVVSVTPNATSRTPAASGTSSAASARPARTSSSATSTRASGRSRSASPIGSMGTATGARLRAQSASTRTCPARMRSARSARPGPPPTATRSSSARATTTPAWAATP